MTVRKHFKHIVRERMKKTGESYTSARRQIIKQTFDQSSPERRHLPGNIPATTALRVLLAAAGVKAPHTKEPFSEEMLFGIAGGVGIGVAAFRYEKEDFSSFFIAGRHLWFDDEAYLKTALARLNVKPAMQQSSGAKAADKQLREALARGPCIAWVDMAHLPHRALPAEFSGGGYHVITIYRIDEEGQTALIGDLTDEPIAIPLADLAAARGRIKKQAHRLLSVAPSETSLDLGKLIKEGLRAGYRALTAKPGKGPLAMSTLESLRRWADRLSGTKDKESWATMFPPGPNLWRALTSLHRWIETYGTGGGLCRPLMADFLTEAGQALADPRLTALAPKYLRLGQLWSELAEAALPDDVPLFRQAKEQHDRYAELFTTNGPALEKRDAWLKLDELAARAKEKFPLSEEACADLRADLQKRVRVIIAEEESALADMAKL